MANKLGNLGAFISGFDFGLTGATTDHGFMNDMPSKRTPSVGTTNRAQEGATCHSSREMRSRGGLGLWGGILGTPVVISVGWWERGSSANRKHLFV